MTTYPESVAFEVLADKLTADDVLKLASNGNMFARQLGWIKVRQAEETANLACVQLVNGPEGMRKLFESIQRLTAGLSRIEKIGKTPLAKQADWEELNDFVNAQH